MIRFIFNTFCIAVILSIAPACGKSDANDIHATVVPGPSGVICYAIVQNGEARGGNCQ